MSQPEISVVIRTFNEEKFLPDLLDALNQQVYQDFETIVVDSGSMDKTRQIAAQKADKLLPIESHDFTFGHSLNVGIQEASGKYIAIVSAHTLPFNAHWLSNLIAPFHDHKTAMVYGRQLGGQQSKFSESRDMRRIFGPKRAVLKELLSKERARVAFSQSRRKMAGLSRASTAFFCSGNTCWTNMSGSGQLCLTNPRRLVPTVRSFLAGTCDGLCRTWRAFF